VSAQDKRQRAEERRAAIAKQTSVTPAADRPTVTSLGFRPLPNLDPYAPMLRKEFRRNQHRKGSERLTDDQVVVNVLAVAEADLGVPLLDTLAPKVPEST
jgi:hypothetical protein